MSGVIDNPAQRGHALLSASGAHRWLNCTPSARLEAQFQDKPSEYAAEGTTAHEVAEACALKLIGRLSETDFDKTISEIKVAAANYNPEMLSYASAYADAIQAAIYRRTVRPYVTTENRVCFSDYVPDGFGTADCLIIGGGELDVIDYKYGRGVSVSAQNNPQLRLYALGALTKYSVLYDINRIRITIVQSRLDHIDTEDITADELLMWGERIKPNAKAAAEGVGDFHPGDWCRFCRAQSLCTARSDEFSDFDSKYSRKAPETLDAVDIGDILDQSDGLIKWLDAVKEYALSAALGGSPIPGYKVVEGRSVRTIPDTRGAFGVLNKAGFDDALLYERKPYGITALEGIVGKKRLGELLSDYIVKPQGKPALVRASDSRGEYVPKTITAADDFTNNL